MILWKIGSICGTNEDCTTERCIQGSCKAKQSVGGSCKGHIECDSGFCIGYTNFNVGLCLDTSAENSCYGEGESCGNSTTGVCVGGFCRNFQLDGGADCLEDEDCLSGACEWSPALTGKTCI